MKASIKYLSSYLPENVMTNYDLEKKLDTNNDWIVSRTGIEERRIADKKESTGDMAVKAVSKLKDKGAVIEDADAAFYNHFYDYDGKIINRIPRLKTGKYVFEDVSDYILDDGTLTGILFGSACGVIYKTEIIRSNNIKFNEKLSFNEDGIFNIEFLSKGKSFIYNAERNLYGYRQYKSFKEIDLDRFLKRVKATDEYIKDIINLIDNQVVQLKRRRLTLVFQLSLVLCQSMKYSFLKKNLKDLWNDFNLEYYKNFLDFSKINSYKKILALLICTKQMIAFIYLIKYAYPLFMKIIRR